GLAASLTVDWDDDRLDRVSDGDLPPAALFSKRQERFLDRCAPGRVNLAAVTALRAFEAIRWDAFTVHVGPVTLEIRAERWTLSPDRDFLELSIAGDVDWAAEAQA